MEGPARGARGFFIAHQLRAEIVLECQFCQCDLYDVGIG
jgi:hypothetical protein